MGHSGKPVEVWTLTEVEHWLESIGLGSLNGAIVKNAGGAAATAPCSALKVAVSDAAQCLLQCPGAIWRNWPGRISSPSWGPPRFRRVFAFCKLHQYWTKRSTASSPWLEAMIILALQLDVLPKQRLKFRETTVPQARKIKNELVRLGVEGIHPAGAAAAGFPAAGGYPAYAAHPAPPHPGYSPYHAAPPQHMMQPRGSSELDMLKRQMEAEKMKNDMRQEMDIKSRVSATEAAQRVAGSAGGMVVSNNNNLAGAGGGGGGGSGPSGAGTSAAGVPVVIGGRPGARTVTTTSTKTVTTTDTCCGCF